MKHLFVPYELALKLKEKGFDEDCLGFYARNHKGEIFAWGNYEWDTCGHTEGWASLNEDAPLYQQVVDWLREKHKINIWVRKSNNSELYFYRLDFVTNYNQNERFSYYHEALDKAIEESLKLIMG